MSAWSAESYVVAGSVIAQTTFFDIWHVLWRLGHPWKRYWVQYGFLRWDGLSCHPWK